MYLDIVLVDTLTPDGVLTTFRVTPKSRHQKVLIDRYRDIVPDRFGQEVDLGGTRIYNSEECSILKADARLRAFEIEDNQFSFQWEHMGVPVGPSSESHGGIYNLVFPPGFRLVDFRIVDPYDKKHPDVRNKKKFRYSVIWDPECKVQLVEMQLRSNRGSFSFVVHGAAALAEDAPEHPYVDAEESSFRVSTITDRWILPEAGKKKLATELADKVDWVDLKPNVFGLGINFNEIIKSCLRIFRKKVQPERR